MARELKYRSHDTDLSALAQELRGQPRSEERDSDEPDYWSDDADRRD